MKKHFNKIISILTFVFVVNIAATVCMAAFSDVDMNTARGKAIAEMQSLGYIQGFGDGTFRPDDTLTRAEFVTIINKMYNYYVQANNIFKDIKSTDWYYADVLAAAQAGYIKGMGDGTFRPNEQVSREQVCVMLNSILKIEENLYEIDITDTVSDWALISVEKVVSNGVFDLEEGGKFRATEPITRGETCVALQKCIVRDTDIDFSFADRERLEQILKNVIARMESDVIPACVDEDTKKVAEMINESLKKYLENPEHDYIADTKEVYEVYRTLGSKKAEEFKSLVFKNMDTDELMVLYNYFYNSDIDSVLGE